MHGTHAQRADGLLGAVAAALRFGLAHGGRGTFNCARTGQDSHRWITGAAFVALALPGRLHPGTGSNSEHFRRLKRAQALPMSSRIERFPNTEEFTGQKRLFAPPENEPSTAGATTTTWTNCTQPAFNQRQSCPNELV